MSEIERLWGEIAGLRRRVAELECQERIGSASVADDANMLWGLVPAASGADAHVLATGTSGQAQIDGLLTLLGQQAFHAATGGVVIAHIPRKGVSDGVAQAVFSITTANETGDEDAGHYSAFVLVHAGQGVTTEVATAASKAALYLWTRAQRATGVGTNSAVSEIVECASAATDPATRDIASISLAAVEASEYVTNAEITVVAGGSNKLQLGASCFVLLVYQVYATPPVITAL